MFDESKIFGGGSELPKTPPQETSPDNLGEEDETKKEIDEAEIEKGQKTELTEEEEKEIEEKAEEVTNFLETQGEKLDQEFEELPEDKREVVEGFWKNAKGKIKEVNKFIKDYSVAEATAAVSMIEGGIAIQAVKCADIANYYNMDPNLRFPLVAVEGTLCGVMALESVVIAAREKRERKERMIKENE